MVHRTEYLDLDDTTITHTREGIELETEELTVVLHGSMAAAAQLLKTLAAAGTSRDLEDGVL